MNADRWARIKELFHEALERAPEDRGAFLTDACAGDADAAALRAEVDRLLSAHVQAGSFIETSPVSAAGESAAPSVMRPAMTGRLIGRYEVGRLVGAGGMGEVYAARDLELGRDVALKIGLGSDTDAHSRLRREAQHASQLNHPHICTIHEVGAFDGQPFIVMEFVEGQRLSDLIPSGGLPNGDVLRYGAQIADGLAHAHRNGVTHRDLKTANIVVTPEGRAKVLDFGLARRLSAPSLKALSQSQASVTAEGLVAGTLSCMAPELLRGEQADAPSDIWALGVLLYEMAAGQRPFAGMTGFELSGAILHQPPPPLPDRIPEALQTIIDRCLAKNPRDRYQNAGEIHSALEAVQADAPRQAPRRSLVQAATPSFLSRCWRHRLAWMLAIVLAYGSYRFLRPNDTPVALGASGRPAIAVMSFANLGGGPETAWLSQGVPSMLLTGLAQTRGLDIVSAERLHEVIRQTGQKSLESLDRGQVSEVAKQAGSKISRAAACSRLKRRGARICLLWSIRSRPGFAMESDSAMPRVSVAWPRFHRRRSRRSVCMPSAWKRRPTSGSKKRGRRWKRPSPSTRHLRMHIRVLVSFTRRPAGPPPGRPPSLKCWNTPID